MRTESESWHEPAVRRLMQQHEGKDPELLVEAYAERCLREADARSLPIDVEGVASFLGIRIRVAEQPFAGRIYVDPSGKLVLDLNAADSESRRRFTCAHEIMHTAFPGFHRDSRYRVDRTVGGFERSRSEEEYLCDRGAAAMLMPASLVTGLFDAGRGLGDVERLAAVARVSLEAAAIRLVSLSDRPTVFLVFEWAYKPADVPLLRRGRPPEQKLRVRYGMARALNLRVPRYASAPDASPYLRSLETGRAVRGTSTVPGDASGRRFLVEAKAYGRAEGMRRVLALARPAK
jgi:hypothetical protein